MVQLLLSLLIAGVVTFFSKFIIHACCRILPIPGQKNEIFQIVLIVVISISSFGFSYYFFDHYNKPSVAHKEPQQIQETKKLSDAKRESVRVLALEALRQGTALSVSISKLPKQEKVYQAAQKLLEISPRYQEQVNTAKANLSDERKKGDKSLINYLNKVAELSRYKPEYISFSLDLIKNGDLTSRERIVTDLLNDHVNSLRNGTPADPKLWLSEFTKRFNDFVD